jgi:hypothetical protein
MECIASKLSAEQDCHSLTFVVGAQRVPAQSCLRLGGGAFAYWTADAIKRYAKNPGPMVPA